MKELLHHLYSHGKLSRNQAKEVMLGITAEKYDPFQVVSFLTVYNMRPISVQELDGFREGLLEKCIRVDFDGQECLDIVGTGGDGKDTFNISTLSAVVMAGAGIKVAKHGSNSATSICGSSNVLKHLGYEFSNDQEILKSQLANNNLCFLHAPFFHPALKSVVPYRKGLKVKTFFNMLGPLVHPAQPSHNFFGVYNASLSRVYQAILEKQNRKFTVVYNMDGYDEISLTDQFVIRSNETTNRISPSDIGMPTYRAADLFGGESISANAKVFMDVLMDKATPAQKDVIVTNAGFGIQLFKDDLSIEEAINMAREAIENGKALSNFKNLLN